MPKFKVEISRTSYQTTTVEIIAKDLFEAREVAQDTAGNYSYTEKDAEYEVGATSEIKEQKDNVKLLIKMHIEDAVSGDIDVKELTVMVANPDSLYVIVANLYEMTPNMIGVQVLNVDGKVLYQEKCQYYTI